VPEKNKKKHLVITTPEKQPDNQFEEEGTKSPHVTIVEVENKVNCGVTPAPKDGLSFDFNSVDDDDEGAPPAPAENGNTPINTLNAGMTPAPMNRKYFDQTGADEVGTPEANNGGMLKTNAGVTPKQNFRKFRLSNPSAIAKEVEIVGKHGDPTFAVGSLAIIEGVRRGAVGKCVIRRSDKIDAPVITLKKKKTKNDITVVEMMVDDDFQDVLFGYTFGMNLIEWVQGEEGSVLAIAQAIKSAGKERECYIGDPEGKVLKGFELEENILIDDVDEDPTEYKSWSS